MDIITTTYPLSLIVLIFGFIIGMGISIFIFGSISFIFILFLLSIGSLRIKPIISLFNQFIESVFPERLELLRKNLKTSFPIKYTTALDKDKQCIFLFHPHGLFTISQFLHAGTNLTEWITKNIKGTALHILWWVPCGKELLESSFTQSNYHDMDNVLKEGKSLGVTLGGVKEMPLAEDNKIIVNIAKRRGIFKMALENGIPLVPIITYGENEIYKISDNWILRKINDFVLKYNLYFPIPKIDSCIKWMQIFRRPLENPVQTFVGSPIEVAKKDNPSDEDICQLRELYFLNLHNLYNTTRPKSYHENLIII